LLFGCVAELHTGLSDTTKLPQPFFAHFQRAWSNDQLREEAIATIEAQPRLEDICQTMLNTAPIYCFEKRQKCTPALDDGPNNYYLCRVTIDRTHSRNKCDQQYLGIYSGTGLSKRMAKMAACKRAVESWQYRVPSYNSDKSDRFVEEIPQDDISNFIADLCRCCFSCML